MTCEPFLKWVGSKRGLIDQLRQLLPAPEFARGYRQPFMGGGSPFWQVYSAVRPAVLSDTNERLVDTYIAVRDHVDELIAELREHEPAYGEAYYYDIRAAVNARKGSLVQRAAYFLIINKWGINGLWRVNRSGECNVAMGKTASGKPPVLCDEPVLRACSHALQGVDVYHERFHTSLRAAKAGEFVYLDPPYHPVSATADFTAYAPGGFSYTSPEQGSIWDEPTDHERLIEELEALDARSVAWVLSNSDCAATRKAYARWKIASVTRNGSMNTDTSKRGKVSEIVVRGKVRLGADRMST